MSTTKRSMTEDTTGVAKKAEDTTEVAKKAAAKKRKVEATEDAKDAKDANEEGAKHMRITFPAGDAQLIHTDDIIDEEPDEEDEEPDEEDEEPDVMMGPLWDKLESEVEDAGMALKATGDEEVEITWSDPNVTVQGLAEMVKQWVKDLDTEDEHIRDRLHRLDDDAIKTVDQYIDSIKFKGI